jgi:two-component system chemotaxis response regulator CheY
MPRVLSVGQCGFDHGTIARRLLKDFGAEVVGAATFEEAVACLRRGGFDLVLVNRITDRDGAPGAELIHTLKADAELGTVPVMLVSNYPEAQDQAASLGALPGFGKSEIGSPQARERLAAVLASRPAEPAPG